MVTPNEFWLVLHQLAQAYSAEGLTPDERAENILAQFRGMPRAAQHELLADLAKLAAHSPDLYSLAIAAASESESAADKPQFDAG